MSESDGEGTVHGHSSDITVGRNRNSSKKVRRNHSVVKDDDQALVLLPCVEPLKGEGLTLGDCVDKDTAVSVAHERLTETSKAFTQLQVDSRQQQTEHVHVELLARVGNDPDAGQYAGTPPSPKKRKAVSQSGGSVYSLAEVLAQFGEIQLNKDFYDSIERTESRCELGSDSVRENDRKAFSVALEKIQTCIQEALDTDNTSENTLFLEELDLMENKQGILKAFRLITMSLEVIQFLMDLGGGTSTSASLTVDETDSVVRSLSKSTSQNVNIKERQSFVSDGDEGQSPLKPSQIYHGKHPRHHDDTKDNSQPSEIASLVSNDPPKRQRKDEDDASSKLPRPTLAEQEKDSHTSRDASIQEEHSPNTSIKHKNTDEKSSSHSDGDRSKQEPQDRWGSSLVCADLSLNEEGSKIYWPFMSALKAAGVISLPHDKESFETIISAYSDMNEGSEELAERILQVVESIYENFDIQANTIQKALGLVAAAFERILASCIKDISSL